MLNRDTDPVEPTYTREQARRILLCLGIFWACWGIAAATGLNGVGVVALVVGIVAGAIVFPTMGDGYREYTGVSGLALVWGWSFARARRKARNAMVFALLRPAWWRGLTETAEWPGRWVAVILGGLLGLDLVLAAVIGSVTRHNG